jgi:chemotaxis protein methyltransferase CheR
MSKGGEACMRFLKWALPRLELRWEGFKKVRGQVCKRINKRLKTLGLHNYTAYKTFLQGHEKEWEILEKMTRISISRFFRDRRDWEVIGEKLLPELAITASMENRPFRCWSVGCASGEEPYSFAILWREQIAPRFPSIRLELIATDADEYLLKRAKTASYTSGSLKDVPLKWLDSAFQKNNSLFRLNHSYRSMVSFFCQDIRKEQPSGEYDIIFCKNLVAMYFSKELSARTFRKLISKLRPGGVLVLGNHEKIPTQEEYYLSMIDKGLNLYEKTYGPTRVVT